MRIHSIEMTIASNSGHPTSCASMAEIMAVLFFTKAGMHFNPKDPGVLCNSDFRILEMIDLFFLRDMQLQFFMLLGQWLVILIVKNY